MRALLFAVLIVLGVWLAVVGLLCLAGRRGLAREIASLLPNLLALFRGLLRDPRVPRGAKVLLVVGVAWIASPIDLIPEFIPVVGPIDDAIVAAIVLRRIVRAAGEEVVREHWRGDPATLAVLLRLAGARSTG